MIHIDPNTLYTRSDLAEMLAPAHVDVDYFVACLRPRRVFKMVYLGEDLLKALRTAPTLQEREKPTALPPKRSQGGRKPKHKNGLIAGLWTPEELGIVEKEKSR